jgi:hypothetical protein
VIKRTPATGKFRGFVPFGALTSVGTPSRGHAERRPFGLTRREILTLAAVGHEDPRGIKRRHADVAPQFGVSRRAISLRIQRALKKLADRPEPAARRYAETLSLSTGRRVKARPILLSLCPNT